jgi:hypothetical protein
MGYCYHTCIDAEKQETSDARVITC